MWSCDVMDRHKWISIWERCKNRGRIWVFIRDICHNKVRSGPYKLIPSPRRTRCLTSTWTMHCVEQMGWPRLHCDAVDHIRAMKQYIKIPSLWSYRTCHWSISSYICQAIRILIAQLIRAPPIDVTAGFMAPAKCRGQMCDSIADNYSRIIACFTSANPCGLV